MHTEHSSQFVKAQQRRRVVVYVHNAKYTFKGRPPPIIFSRVVKPMNALQLGRLQSLHNETLYRRPSRQAFFK